MSNAGKFLALIVKAEAEHGPWVTMAQIAKAEGAIYDFPLSVYRKAEYFGRLALCSIADGRLQVRRNDRRHYEFHAIIPPTSGEESGAS